MNFPKYNSIDKGVFLLWCIIVTVFVALTVAFFVFAPSIDSKSTTPSTFTTMENKELIMMLVSLALLIFTTIGNPIHLKRYRKTLNLIQSLETILIDTKKDLSNRISDTEHTLKFYIVQRDISNALHKVTSDALVYMPNEHHRLINEIGDSILEFALQIHDYGIHNYNTKNLCVKVDALLKCTLDCLNSGMNPAFVKTIENLLRTRILKYKDDIREIAGDNVTNSKMNRFRALSEVFAQEYLSIIIINYLKDKD